MLRKPSRPAQISDELESFFYVLLHCSIRHLRSNCSCPTSWIDTFFNEYGGTEGPFGWKCMAVTVDDWLDGPFPHRVLFRSPMDDVLRSLLQCFRAHYKVASYDKMITQPPLPAPESPPPDESIHYVGGPDIVLFGDDAKDGNHCDSGHSSSPEEEVIPTIGDRELSAQILEHMFMIEKIEMALRTLDWPEEDRRASPESRTPASLAAQTSEVSRVEHTRNKKQRIL